LDWGDLGVMLLASEFAGRREIFQHFR